MQENEQNRTILNGNPGADIHMNENSTQPQPDSATNNPDPDQIERELKLQLETAGQDPSTHPQQDKTKITTSQELIAEKLGVGCFIQRGFALVRLRRCINT